MKLFWGFLASSLCCTASAVRPSVSPETARLIIAQRLGLSRFHAIEHADAEAIRHINTFGGRPSKLFGQDDADKAKAHLLIWMEGVDEAEATVVTMDGTYGTRHFTISNVPSATDNDRLVSDLIAQAESLPAIPDPQKRTYRSALEMEAALRPLAKADIYNDYLTVSRVSVDDASAREKLALLFDRLPQGFAMTIVRIPRSATRAKRATNLWGSYDVPSPNEVRRQNPEALLTSQAEPSSSPAPPVTNLGDFPFIPSQAEDNSPVRGILPSCFDSMSACQRQTRNCSSHGECKLLHKGRGSGSDRQTVDCYGCACSPTIQDLGKDKGKKVTYWGGPACQKKDISVQFWLFVGSGIVLAFLVSSGIGMLYSMGSEELPSVIGAGVSGPTRK